MSNHTGYDSLTEMYDELDPGWEYNAGPTPDDRDEPERRSDVWITPKPAADDLDPF